MDSGLKERLVGAAVLVALGVWLIPWVLDGREPIPAETPPADTVKLPTAESPTRTETRTIALTDPSHAPAADTTGPESAVPAAASAVEVQEHAAGAIGSATTDTGPAADAPAPPATKPATVSPAAPARADAESTQVKPVDGWFVQLGSFGNVENAKRLAGRVSTFGYTADVSPYRSGGRTLNRVRVGPSATREEAEVIASSLSAHGFVAQVVSAD